MQGYIQSDQLSNWEAAKGGWNWPSSTDLTGTQQEYIVGKININKFSYIYIYSTYTIPGLRNSFLALILQVAMDNAVAKKNATANLLRLPEVKFLAQSKLTEKKTQAHNSLSLSVSLSLSLSSGPSMLSFNKNDQNVRVPPQCHSPAGNKASLRDS